jgi:hypothetical protein
MRVFLKADSQVIRGQTRRDFGERFVERLRDFLPFHFRQAVNQISDQRAVIIGGRQCEGGCAFHFG